MRARAREDERTKRVQEKREAEVEGGGGREEMSFTPPPPFRPLLARGRKGALFQETIVCVSLPETVLFFYKFRRPCRRSPEGCTPNSVPSSNELTATVLTQLKTPLERDCSLYQAILPRRSLASVVMWRIRHKKQGK